MSNSFIALDESLNVAPNLENHLSEVIHSENNNQEEIILRELNETDMEYKIFNGKDKKLP